MGRDRSPSERSSRGERRRDKERRREKERRRHRSRSRSNSNDRSDRHRSRSRSPLEHKKAQTSKAWDREREKLRKKEKDREARLAMEAKLTEADLAGKTEEEIDMMKMMGFNGFTTSKGKKVKGNDVGDVHVVVKRKYRQYMNRKGGFNRPLDYVH